MVKSVLIKSRLIFLCFLFILKTIPCIAQNETNANIMQRVEIPSSPNPVGSGARALGMGGAFIAVADDATAASWNPAGLSILDRPEVSFVGAAFHRIEDNSFRIYPKADGDQTVSDLNLNYLSAAYPFTAWNRHMVVSLNYQHLYDFTRKWNFPIGYSGENAIYDQNTDYQSEGSLSALGLAYCILITPQISLGLTMNIWDDELTDNKWETKLFQWGEGTDNGNRFTEEIQSFDRYLFSGINFNLGMLWRNVGDTALTIGAVIKTPFEADLDHEHSFKVFTQYPDLTSRHDYSDLTEYNRGESLDMPLSFGMGFAYRFSDVLTASLDIYTTRWDDFIMTDADGREISPITGKSPGESDIDPTWQVRAGGEYLVYQTADYLFPLCFGAFYDPAPAQGSPDNFFGFTIGSGVAHKKWFTFDIAYQYRFGNNVGSSILNEWGFSQDIQEHTVYSSVIVYF